MMNYKKINDEVYYSQEDISTMSAQDLDYLKAFALKNPRQRVRLCTHKRAEDKIHEMFIIHGRDAYIRPHKHLTRGESFQILEGEADIILYDDAGNVTRIIEMGDSRSGKIFYFRLDTSIFHTLRIHSPVLCFKEVTSGPFNKGDIVFSPWSPNETDLDAVAIFKKDLSRSKVNA
jgi:cupin fold WbuC family metalloprotein